MRGASLALIVGSVWLAPLLIACNGQDSARAVEKAPAAARAATPVEVETVRRRPLARRIPIVGTLHPAEEAVISTKAAGILRRTFVDVGSAVRPGDPLAQVDRVDYEVAVRQAEAAQAEVLARLGVVEVPGPAFDLKTVSTVERAAAQLENARFSYERLLRLSKGVSANVADQELNDASTRLRVTEADHRLAIDEAAALVATARERQSSLQMARQSLENTLTRTPPIPTTLGGDADPQLRQLDTDATPRGDGAGEWVVAARLVTEGQYVSVADPLYRLIISNPLKLRSKVPERYAGWVAIDRPVELEVVGGGAVLGGRIVRVSPDVEPASRTFEIEALIDNAAGAVKPGAFAKGVIVDEGAAPVICVPAEAVVTTGGATSVFVVEGDVVRQRTIQTGDQADEWIEVVTGLAEGEQIVARGAAALRDGMAVEVR